MENLIQYWPQITVIAITCISISIEVYSNGRIRYYKFPNLFELILLACGPIALFFGGFFHLSVPFFIWLVLWSIGIGLIFKRVGEPRKDTSIFGLLIVIGLIHGLYYWGGFYDVFIK